MAVEKIDWIGFKRMPCGCAQHDEGWWLFSPQCAQHRHRLDEKSHPPDPRDALIAELRWALLLYIEWHGADPFHDNGCPEDDTCACANAARLVEALALADARAATGER